MNIIFVIFLANTIVCAQDFSDETKYIDLLPEKEKTEFLERIARRIFDEVQSKDDGDKVSIEVSDTELDKHDEFVRKILKEETLNLRTSADVASENMKKNVDIDIKKEEKKESLGKIDVIQNNVDEAAQGDFTLQDNKRNKRNNLEKSNKDSKIIHINGDVKGEIKIPNIESDVSYAKSDVEDIQIKHFKRSMAENTNELEITTQSTEWMGTQMIDFIPEDTHKSQEKFEDSINSDHNGLRSYSNSTEHVHKSQEGKIPETEQDSDEKEGKSQEKFEDSTNSTHNGFRSYSNSTEQVHTSQEGKIPETEQDSDEKEGKAEDIVSATTGEPSSPDVKPTEVTTEKLSNISDTTTVHQSISPKDQFLKSNTVAMSLDNIKTLVTENDIKHDADQDLLAVAVENLNELDSKMNLEKNNPGAKNDTDVVELHSDISVTEITTTPFTTEYTTEIAIEIDSSTLKTDGLTTAALRTETEVNNAGDSNLEELVNGKVTTYRPNMNLVRNVDGKPNSSALIGSNEYPNKKQDKNIEVIGEMEYTSTKSKEDDSKNSYSLDNDVVKVLKTRLEVGSNEKKFNDLRAMYETMTAKEYNVYEIPTGKQPFLKKERLNVGNKENPYYVPIYNYSPNNAYYNPHNHLGPNADDDNDNILINANVADETDDNKEDLEEDEKVDLSDDRDTLNNDNKRLFRGYIKENKRQFRFSKQNKDSSFKLNLPVVVKYPKFTNIVLNPNDYLDMDYYYGRSQHVSATRNLEREKKVYSSVPDSLEKDHPINDIHEENLKSYLKSVRQQQTNGKQRQRKKHTREKGIAMDYFFGNERSETYNEDSETGAHFNKQKKTNKHPHKAYDIENINKPYHKIYEDLSIMTNKGKNYQHDDIKPATPAYIDVYTQHYSAPNHYRVVKKKNTNTEKYKKGDADESDLESNSDALLKLNLTTITETRNTIDLEPYVMVLEDMIRNGNRGLEQYNWLGTTVDIQAALTKLMDMTDAMHTKTRLSQPDIQLLKYFIYLHKSSKNMSDDKRKTISMPRNKKKKKGIIKESGLLHRNWLYRMVAEATKQDQIVTNDDIKEFNEFLNNLQYYLYDLHTAMQQITVITKYRSQRWFENLKELYLDTTRKNLLEVLLHMTTSRLLDLVEDSAKKGVEDDFLTYALNNAKDVKRTKEELKFVLEIIKELMKLSK